MKIEEELRKQLDTVKVSIAYINSNLRYYGVLLFVTYCRAI